MARGRTIIVENSEKGEGNIIVQDFSRKLSCDLRQEFSGRARFHLTGNCLDIKEQTKDVSLVIDVNEAGVASVFSTLSFPPFVLIRIGDKEEFVKYTVSDDHRKIIKDFFVKKSL